jgi:V8-like Glu-specific endopeptidase
LIDGLDQLPPVLTVSGYFRDECREAWQITHSIPLHHPKNGGIMYSIDTKCGQSGSPLYVKGKENVHLIGIHKAYNNIYKLNTGVFITP